MEIWNHLVRQKKLKHHSDSTNWVSEMLLAFLFLTCTQEKKSIFRALSSYLIAFYYVISQYENGIWPDSLQI